MNPLNRRSFIKSMMIGLFSSFATIMGLSQDVKTAEAWHPCDNKFCYYQGGCWCDGWMMLCDKACYSTTTGQPCPGQIVLAGSCC